MKPAPFHFSVRTFRLPGWVTPLLVLLALAMIPVAIALALAVLGVALGVGLVRAFLPPAGTSPPEGMERPGIDPDGYLEGKGPESRTRNDVIDVEYEAKDDDEQG